MLEDSVQCVGAVVNAIQSVSPLVPAVAGGVEGVAELRTTTRPNLSHMCESYVSTCSNSQ